MFTGLVQVVGRVGAVTPTARGVRLEVRIPPEAGWSYRPAVGDSIAVNGCCLTVAAEPVAEGQGLIVAFDAIAETLRRTTLGGLKPGSRVNLEHAARADTLLGGHIVQGHVDAVGRVRAVQADPADWRVTIELAGPAGDGQEHPMDLIAPKGSVTVEGVSLTVAEALDDGFVVALIPTTLEKTTLDELKPGDGCNIETDLIARQVVHYLRRQRG